MTAAEELQQLAEIRSRFRPHGLVVQRAWTNPDATKDQYTVFRLVDCGDRTRPKKLATRTGIQAVCRYVTKAAATK